MEITNFVSKKSKEENTIELFEQLCKKVKTKKEIRKIEMRILQPKPIRKYQGKKSGIPSYKMRSIVFAFPSQDYITMLSNHIKINTYQGNNSTDVTFLIELIRLLDDDRIIWKKKSGKYYLKTKNGKRIKI